jgi:CRP-like cAMP-binding protein
MVAHRQEQAWALAADEGGRRLPLLARPGSENFLTTPDLGRPTRGNALLTALSPGDMAAMRPLLEAVPLIKGTPIFQSGEPAQHVWFPDTGIISIVAMDEQGSAIEVATVGREGMTGLAVVLGSETLIYAAMVQVPGAGWRIPVSEFRQIIDRHPSVKALALRYVSAAMTQMGQNVACGQLHDIEARCARWLLLAHDDVDGDVFSLTQDYLAMMLGVTRPSVSTAASALQRRGLIRYVRGQMTVLDRAGLEATSCECYGIVRREFERLLQV